MAELDVPKRVIEVPKGDVGTRIADCNFAAKVRGPGRRRCDIRFDEFFAAGLLGAIAVGLDNHVSDRRTVDPVLNPDFQTGQDCKAQNDKPHDHIPPLIDPE